MVRWIRTLSWLTFCSVLSGSALLVGACSSSQEERVAEDIQVAAPAAAGTLILPVDDNTVAVAVQLADGSVNVEIGNLEGRTDFTASFYATNATRTTLDFTFFPP